VAFCQPGKGNRVAVLVTPLIPLLKHVVNVHKRARSINDGPFTDQVTFKLDFILKLGYVTEFDILFPLLICIDYVATK